MSVTLVHDFETEVSAVEDVRPGVDDATLRVKDGLVEVEAVEVEGHGADSQCGEPDADYWPCT